MFGLVIFQLKIKIWVFIRNGCKFQPIVYKWWSFKNKWADKLNYHAQSTDDALELFKWLRKTSYDLVKTVDEQTWQTATVNHSENGIMTLEQWLKIYDDHVPIHIRQMKRNLEAWKALKQAHT